MASPALRIRVRCPKVCPTPIQLEGCTSQTTYGQFQSIVSSALGLENGGEGLSVLAGFPPRPLEMANDAEIGSKLSDNESITVRLPAAAAGIQQGGKWGRSKRPKPNPPTRASSRASKPSSSAAAGAANAGGGDGGKGKKKSNGKGKGKKANEPSTASGGRTSGGGAAAGRRAAAGSASSNGTTGGRGGVHTLGGPLTPPPASPRGGGSGGRSGQASSRGSGSPPGQVRTLFGSSASTPGRAGGSSSSSSSSSANSAAAAAAAAARRAGVVAAPGGASPSSAAAGGEPDAVAAAVAAAAGESGGGGGPSNRKRPRAGTGVQLKSEGDIAERLLTAVAGGGKGTADRFFRKAMKLAVDKQYDQSRADARVRAALGGWYTAEASAMQRRLGDGESVALNISFSKGAGTKSQLTETVDRIPRGQVAAVVRMIARDPESREMLKPHNFAGCSPRMFWSLVQHWGGDVPAALRLAAPDVDWSFLDSRDRKPSEKAVANAAAEEEERRQAEQERAEKEKAKRKRERRKRRKEGIQTDSSDEDDNEDEEPEEAVPALAAGVGLGGEEGSDAARAADARRRAANAALARLTASQHRPAAAVAGGAAGAADAAAVSAPPEEAGRDASIEEEEEEKEEVEVEVDLEGLTEIVGEPGAKLLVAVGVRTPGQLADRDEEELARELAVLQEQQQKQQQGETGVAAEPAGGGGGSSSSSSTEEEHRIDAEQVSEWVQSARGNELDEIMADIVGEDEDIVEALEQVSVSTPRDLVRLGAFPDVLVGAVRDRLGAEAFAPLAGRITAGAVDKWRRKGDRLLEQRPWLELWVHGG